MSDHRPPSVPRHRLDVMRTVVMLAAGLWFACAVVYQLRAAAAVQDGGGSLDATIAWFGALQGIALVAFVGSVGIYVVLWLDERRSG